MLSGGLLMARRDSNKPRKAAPAIPPFIDQWGNPTYENPWGQNPPNPAFLQEETQTESDATSHESASTQRNAQQMIQRRVRNHRRARRATAVVVAIGSSFVGVTAASAYWTAAGVGSGNATTGTVQALTVAATGTVTSQLLPGGTADLHLIVTNPNGFAVKVTGITQTPSSSITVTGGIGVGAGACTSANAGVTVSGIQPQLPLTITQINGNAQTVDLIAGASMSTSSVTGCQQASFTIPVTLTVKMP